MHISNHDLKFQITGYRVRNSGAIGCKILLSSTNVAIGPNYDAFAFTILFSAMMLTASLGASLQRIVSLFPFTSNFMPLVLLEKNSFLIRRLYPLK